MQAANLAGFRASEDPRFEAGIPDFMNGILNFSIHFNVVHRKVDWWNPKMKSLNSMPVHVCERRTLSFIVIHLRAVKKIYTSTGLLILVSVIGLIGFPLLLPNYDYIDIGGRGRVGSYYLDSMI